MLFGKQLESGEVSTFKKLTMSCTLYSYFGDLLAGLFIRGANDHSHKEKCSAYQNLVFPNVLDGGAGLFCPFLAEVLTT